MSDASDLDTGEAIRQAGAPAIPDDWRPWRVNEITEEVSRLRDLARRVRLQPESVKRVATQWLQPSRDELAALTRWYNGASVIESRGALAADLRDAVKLVAKATTPEQWTDDPEAMAARLEHFAESLDPQLRRWLSELQRTPEEKQAMTAASLEYIRARRIGGVLPKYATAELRADPIRAMLRAGDEMGKLEKAIVRSRDLHGGLANATCTRIEAAWLRARNLLVRVVDDAAALVVASGGNPAPLFMAAETVKQGQAGEFVQQWPAVATVLRTAQARLQATPPFSINGVSGSSQQDDDTNGEPSSKGVTLRDIGLSLDFVDDQLPDFVRRFSDSKRIKAKPLGKCPVDGRCKLYGLSEILSDFEGFSPLSRPEFRRIRKYLENVARHPAK